MAALPPSGSFCPNPSCSAYGQRNARTLIVHSTKDRRLRCRLCGKTFSQTIGTPFYRRHVDAWLMGVVVTLLAYGCPRSAITHAFALDPRTVVSWEQAAGDHTQSFHQEVVETGQVHAQHIQADELRVRVLRGILWLAVAIDVPTRLWLGAVLRPGRDATLLTLLFAHVQRCVAHSRYLLCVDGFGPYLRAARHILKQPLRTGRRGRPRLVWPAGFLLARVVKHVGGRWEGRREAVVGTLSDVLTRLSETGTGTQINTAYIERFNATLRARLAPLARRTRRLAGRDHHLARHVALVGTLYNFCTPHPALTQQTADGWQMRTPAMAAGLTDHVWTTHELLTFPIITAIPLRRAREPVPLLFQNAPAEVFREAA